jgi:hypothetical protein
MTMTSMTDVDQGNVRTRRTDHRNHRRNRPALFGNRWEASAVPHLFWLIRSACLDGHG